MVIALENKTHLALFLECKKKNYIDIYYEEVASDHIMWRSVCIKALELLRSPIAH